MRGGIAACLLAGCYAPHPSAGAPCGQASWYLEVSHTGTFQPTSTDPNATQWTAALAAFRGL